MADIKLSSGDIDLSGSQFSLTRGNDAIAQHVSIRLQLFQGEWFLDTRVGIPYYRDILVKNPNLPAIGSIFQEVISTTTGIKSIGNFNLEFLRTERILNVTFQAASEDSDEILDYSEALIIV
jgi:hypothetical protein